MRTTTLQALAWATVAAAVGSALWLAAAEPQREAPDLPAPPSFGRPSQTPKAVVQPARALREAVAAEPAEARRRSATAR